MDSPAAGRLVRFYEGAREALAAHTRWKDSRLGRGELRDRAARSRYDAIRRELLAMCEPHGIRRSS